MPLNAMDLALGVISDKARRSKKLEARLREIDRLAAQALAAKPNERTAMLREISSKAGTAITEERSFADAESERLVRMKRLTRN